MTIIDLVLPTLTVMVTQGLLRTIFVIISVSIVNPYLLIVALFGLIYMLYVTKKGIKPMLDA